MKGKCLLVLTACCLGLGSSRALAADNPLITSKISERRNRDGKLQWRDETFSPGKSRILRIQQSFRGDTTNTFRMYMVGGETLMVDIQRHAA